LGKRRRPEYLEEVKPTRAVETLVYEDDIPSIVPQPTESQSSESQKALYTLLSMVPDAPFYDLKQGMESLGFWNADEMLAAMYEEAMKPTRALDSFVNLLFREAHVLTSPVRVTDLSRRLASLYSTTSEETRFMIQVWLSHCVYPLMDLHRLFRPHYLTSIPRPCFRNESGEWTLSDFSKTKYFEERAALLDAARASMDDYEGLYSAISP
jgi:hypothetical protein